MDISVFQQGFCIKRQCMLRARTRSVFFAPSERSEAEDQESRTESGKVRQEERERKKERERARAHSKRPNCHIFYFYPINLRHNIWKFVENFQLAITRCQQNPRLVITFSQLLAPAGAWGIFFMASTLVYCVRNYFTYLDIIIVSRTLSVHIGVSSRDSANE